MTFCKWLRCVFVLPLALVACVAQQPNIVFIMADDMGWNDVSFHGSDQIQTPNIDTLAIKGVVLQQYYSEAICTPARTALLTGKYPMRLGMQGLPLFNSEDRGIPLSERLLPSYLREQGYATHLVGKWHVGMSRDEYLPTNRGYDTHFGMRGGFIDYYTYNKIERWPNGRSMFGLDMFDGSKPLDTLQGYVIDKLTERAVNIIEKHNSSRPLFLHITHNAPHAGNDGSPLQPPLNRTSNNLHIAHSDRRLYADVVNSLDRSVGEVVQALSKNNMLDNTIIIFVSDNGSPTIGTFSNWGNNVPFRGIKSTPWEGAVRVPAVIWHSSLRPKVWDGVMHISDWLPTLASVAGAPLNKDIDGINQWDAILHGANSNRREVLISLYTGGTNNYAAYRAGDYKIIIGNVTGLANGYYGSEFLAVKGKPPNYYEALQSCETARSLRSMGLKFDALEVETLRQAVLIKQIDTMRDQVPCEPTLGQGCLYNLKKDPTESHNLWGKANKIATLLTSRLRVLWSSQLRRGSLNLQPEADPANFNYTWEPWIRDWNTNDLDNHVGNSVRYEVQTDEDNDNLLYSYNSRNTVANPINCSDSAGLRHFLCVLRSVF